MLESFAELFPAEWRPAMLVLTAPFRWMAAWQATMLHPIFGGSLSLGVIVAAVLLLAPALLVASGAWCTMASLYTLPFRSGRGSFLTSLLMAWWDAGRCIWLFWAGMARLTVAVFGWLLGAVRFVLLTLRNIVFGLVRSPMALLDWTSRRYFQP